MSTDSVNLSCSRLDLVTREVADQVECALGISPQALPEISFVTGRSTRLRDSGDARIVLEIAPAAPSIRVALAILDAYGRHEGLGARIVRARSKIEQRLKQRLPMESRVVSAEERRRTLERKAARLRTQIDRCVASLRQIELELARGL